MVCYYSSLSCKACVDFAISKVDEFFSDTEQQSHICYIACDFNEKFKLRKQNTIRWNQRSKGLAIDESNSICYFLIDKNKVNHIFIPEKKLRIIQIYI